MQELARVNPMSCQEVERWLHLQADDEIADEDRPPVEDHLSDCEACRQQLALIERMKVGLQTSAAMEAPASLLARVDGERKKASRARRGAVLLAAAPMAVAACALVVSGLAFFGKSERASTSPTSTASVRFADEALAAHQLEVPVDVASQDPSRVARFLERRVGAALEIPRLDDHGLSLAGGRVVSVAERRGAQIVYRSSLGERLSVVAVPDPKGELFKSADANAKLTLRRVGDITYAYVGEAAAKLSR